MDRKIKSITIIPGCVSCGSCEVICPEVFEVNEIAKIRKNSDLNLNSEGVCEASDMCPVGAIQIEESDR
jgi:ferredoxin